jgi:hypothetical protein
VIIGVQIKIDAAIEMTGIGELFDQVVRTTAKRRKQVERIFSVHLAGKEEWRRGNACPPSKKGREDRPSDSVGNLVHGVGWPRDDNSDEGSVTKVCPLTLDCLPGCAGVGVVLDRLVVDQWCSWVVDTDMNA